MKDDYLAYWGIKKPPFSLTPDPEMLYLSTQHSECLMRLKYAIFSQKGGALLVSDNAGNGKTSVLAKLNKDLDDYYAGRVKVAFIDHPTLTPIEMIGEIAHQLGAELHTTEKIRALNHLRDRLFSLYNENVKVVVIVDEGQMLKDRPDILGELRILLNFCVSDAFLLTFIFSGQKPLDSVLREMPEFWQRLPVRFFLRNLDFKDTKGLLKYRIEKVGGNREIFTEDAFEGIYNYSEGCPRIMCAVADLCLVIGYAKGTRHIGFVEVSTACRDMESSGDGFHYYAFVKSQKQSLAGKPESEILKPEKSVSSEKSESLPEKQPRLTLINTVVCPSCSEPNSKERRFCVKCDHPLYRKCSRCGMLIDTVSNECPVCNTNIDEAKNTVIENIKRDLKPFDIMENSGNVWLQAAGINLEEEENVLIIFPRGNVITPGPSVHTGKTEKKSSGEPCDIILTDKRLIIRTGSEFASTELIRIDTCMVSDTGKLIGNRYILILGFNGHIYKVFLPYGSRKTKTILNHISLFVQTEMIK